MFKSVKHFLSVWTRESGNTSKVLGGITDGSLAQQVAPGHRKLGELAWHIVTSVHGIVGQTGLEFEAPGKKSPIPATAAEIAAGYRIAADGLAQAIRAGWTDETLEVRDTLYGYEWPRGFTLELMLFHEIHHRGQATVLMRQAGVSVPKIYG